MYGVEKKMNTDEWSKTNKKCKREGCNRSLYSRNFSSAMYNEGDLVCPIHGENYTPKKG